LSERWASATRLPTTIDAMARPATIGCHSGVAVGKVSISSRVRAANAAALTPVAMNPVTGVGEPS